ncbi:MAG: hypothetical protein ABFS56_11630 [Pseudomonadota bacterium]
MYPIIIQIITSGFFNMTNTSKFSTMIVTAHKLAKQVNAPDGILTILNNINLELHAGEGMVRYKFNESI